MVLVISQSGSKKVGSKTYSLKCAIPDFSSQATWSRAGVHLTSCLPSGCLTASSPPYTFRNDASAIYVDFATLGANENGIIWTCAHTGDVSVSFTVEVEDVEEETGTLADDVEEETGTLAGGLTSGFGARAVAIGAGIGALVFKHIKHNNNENTEQ